MDKQVWRGRGKWRFDPERVTRAAAWPIRPSGLRIGALPRTIGAEEHLRDLQALQYDQISGSIIHTIYEHRRYVHLMENTSPSSPISPATIAAGIGLASRREICGLLALLEASGATEMLKGLAAYPQDKLRKRSAQAGSQVVRIGEGLLRGPSPTDALRHRLWFEIAKALGLPDQLPLSMRTLHSEATAIGVRASEVLRPSVIAKREGVSDADAGPAKKARRKVLRSLPVFRSDPSDEVSFPDIVAAELTTLMDGLNQPDVDRKFDPEVAAAIRKAQLAMSSAAVAGGGWAAFASAVGSAGFAPYIMAAKLSAFIPFVSGPALVSFLAVMQNPVTVIAGTAAIGYWAIKGKGSSAREVVAARVAVLLALRGMQDQERGIASLATAFRGIHRLPGHDLGHLKPFQYEVMTRRTSRLEQRFGNSLPPAVSRAPGTWGRPLPSESCHHVSDAALAGALTAGDMLYHVSAVDPSVLAAADFSRTLAVESPLELAVHVSSFATMGAQIGLRGYTAEQLVMARLVEQGHVVELATASTVPGYDLIVDGNPVQVKCGTSISLLQEHFAKYPDIPVIADVGLARMAEASGEPWAYLVTTVDGFDLEHVQSIVDHSLAAAQSLGESMMPVYAMIVGGARAATKAWRGEIPVEDLPAWLVLDLSIRGGLAAAGQTGGAFVGLLVIGPAGALVLGPVVGVAALLGTGQLHELLDRAIRSQWHSEVMEAAETLRLAFGKACERQLELMLQRQRRLRQTAHNGPQDLMSWLDRRMVDDLISAWETLDGITSISSLRGAMELMVRSRAVGLTDSDVMSARNVLAARLEAKPSTVDNLSHAGGALANLAHKKFRRL